MADEKQGWKIIESKSVPVTVAFDVGEGQVGKLDTATTASVAGSGDVPAGVFSRDMDVSEGETETELVRADRAVVAAAAAIVSLDIPVKVGAAGTCEPCDTDKDIVLGMPLNLQATVGGDVKIDLTLLGSYYAV